MADARTAHGEASAAGAGVRVGFGLLLAAVLLLLLWLDAAWEEGYVYAACGAGAVALALGEFVGLAALSGARLHRQALVLGGTLLFLAQWAGWTWPAAPDPWLAGCVGVALAAAAGLGAPVLKGRIEDPLQAAAAGTAAVVYLPLMLGFLTAVRAGWGVAGLVTVLAVTKGGASGAYFVGKLIGRTPLAPRISPRKTVEGAVGQMVASVAMAWALSLSPWSLMGPGAALACGALVGGAAMLGDLVASLLKRQAGLKDSGRLVPGIGGMLDMLDDVLFAAPVSYVFLLCLGAGA
jgi:phosphatidate cytidylyltransferase